jgi:hypothetical protein
MLQLPQIHDKRSFSNAEKGSANSIQHGGNHYKQHTYETWDVIADWGLGYFDGNAVKYLSRWRHKGGVEDLRKARHYIDKLIEMETRVKATAEPHIEPHGY